MVSHGEQRFVVADGLRRPVAECVHPAPSLCLAGEMRSIASRTRAGVTVRPLIGPSTNWRRRGKASCAAARTGRAPPRRLPANSHRGASLGPVARRNQQRHKPGRVWRQLSERVQARNDARSRYRHACAASRTARNSGVGVPSSGGAQITRQRSDSSPSRSASS